MIDTISERFAQQLAFEGELRVEWRALAALPTGEALMRLRDANLTVLNLVSAVEEHRSDGTDDETGGAGELVRLDAKVNLLLELVQRLVARDQMPPARLAVRFNAHGLSIERPANLAGAQWVTVYIHLDACRAMPLELPAQVVVLPDQAQVLLAFQDIGPAIEEALDRLVFRYHRRQIAIDRRNAREE
ncbi:MAG: PilZ domain-containing protein [Xanthomonadaceae bacterium]|nr:PilZ domain-containing protein [Xanthomonadaceae bacterium]MDP2186399.1 PilZ domain-containing protein [Xanthomonadales bacterium]MDZ4115263.1 PilZ domain-containing protein [Xanthomonadaceae bacterium]MDZ4378338.1 PilZ domain-containing protein [Xanthomonadaceae bacterium]